MRFGLLVIGVIAGYHIHRSVDESLYAIRKTNPVLDQLIMGVLIGAAGYFFVGEFPNLIKELKMIKAVA